MPATAPPPARVTLHTFGECRIVVEHAAGTTTLTPASDRLFALALLLAADAGRPVARPRLAAWLWPDLPDAAARHALRQLLYRLRRLGVTVDADAAHLTLRATPAAATPGPGSAQLPPRAGRCLPGWNPPGQALAAWVDRYRASTEAAARTALARALTDAPAGHPDRIALAAALLELDPRHPLARATLPPTTIIRERPATPSPLPFVGREDVLEAVRARAVRAAAGHGAAVVLAAAAGVGVSRTIAELARAAHTLGFSPLPDAADSAPATSVARALASAARALLDRPGALGASPDALRVVRRFAATALLPTGDTTVRRLGAALADLARAVAAETPLFLGVDARCVTAAERALAAAFARTLDGAPVLAAFTALPATPSTFAALSAAADIVPIPPLTDQDAATLATHAARARGRSLDADDVAWCTTVARGRPGDVIALADHCAARPATRTVPAPIAARLRDHVAALPLRTRQVAALCALLGDTDVADRAARALDRPRTAVDAALFQLRRADLPGVDFATDPRPPHRDAVRLVGATALATLDAGEREVLIARATTERRQTERRRKERRRTERRHTGAAA